MSADHIVATLMIGGALLWLAVGCVGAGWVSGEALRRAAALMRERAEAATPGPWLAGLGAYVEIPEGDEEPSIADTWGHRGNAEHIASWHPAIALAVADWLDTAGADLWAHGPLCECGSGCLDCDDDMWQPHVRRALAVARAYLGADA